MIKPYYEEDGITLYNGDCLEILPHLPKVDLVLTDPPYGIGNFVQIGGNVRGTAVDWNEHIPPPIFFKTIKEKSKYRIIWGANYFNCFEENGGAIIWIKNQPMPNFSKAEIASCSFYKKVETVSITWTNFVNTKESNHPCERPVSLYDWCIDYAPEFDTMVDPYCGSGSVLVAAKRAGKQAIGIEQSQEYCEITVNRLRQGVLSLV